MSSPSLLISFTSIILLAWLWTSLQARETAMQRWIRSIKIERFDVFPRIDRKPEFLYKLANRLHIKTRESVIKGDLLFQVGDEYDPELLAESERRLRRLAYLGKVKISAINVGPDSVDIKVMTVDQWSTLISAIVDQSPGRTILGGALEEFNLFGFGKQFFAEARHERDEGTTFTLLYNDPQVAGSRWTAQASGITGPFLRQISVEIARPFYALDVDWAGGTSAQISDRTVRLFEDGIELPAPYDENEQSASVFVERAFGSRFRRKRLRLAYRFHERDVTILPDSPLAEDEIPVDELSHRLSMRLRLEDISFVEENRLDRFQKTEDVTLGAITSISLGRTGIPINRGVKRFEFSAGRRQAHRLTTGQYLFLNIAGQTQFEKNTFVNASARYYNKSFPHQTLAINAEYDFSRDSEFTTPFLLGSDSGLRGYPARQFAGTRRLLLNIEDRIFTPVEILTVALGGVIFFDAGNVWRARETVDFADLNYGAGFGLRLGYTKSPNSRVGRIDFGWALNTGGFAISIGIDQQFSFN